MGLGCRVSIGDVPRVGEAFNGVICFQSGTNTSVAGTVVRVDGETVGVSLDRLGIPLEVILREQVYLRRHFPVGE